MARHPNPQPYFQRVAVPGMAPHFELLGPPTEDGFLEPAPRPARVRRRRWPAVALPGRRGRLVLVSGLVAAVVLAGAGLALQRLLATGPWPAGPHWPSLWSSTPAAAPAPAPAAPVAQVQLRLLLRVVDDCRGAESLMVMLPEGGERAAALERMQRQQQQIRAWLRDNATWLAAAHGKAAVADLLSAVAAWQQLQQQIADAEVVEGFNGRARTSRNLMAGPSGGAYRQVLAVLDGLVQGQP